MTEHIQLPDPQSTYDYGYNLGQILPPKSVILLSGDLGSGKTSLVQGIAKGLGIEEAIVSPTFTLINEYSEGRIPLYHLDLYRLQPAEVATMFLESYWEGIEVEPGIVAIEWSERLPYQPHQYLKLHLSYTPTGRRLEVTQVNNFLI
jgi:tRNA threonylcarbamoyladenosine biosynthesis protein TsaE